MENKSKEELIEQFKEYSEFFPEINNIENMTSKEISYIIELGKIRKTLKNCGKAYC